MGSDLEEESTPCEECGEPVDFTSPEAFYKTADERFWHEDCYGQLQKVDRLEKMRDEIMSNLLVPERIDDGLSDEFHLRLDNIQAEMHAAISRERTRQEQEVGDAE